MDETHALVWRDDWVVQVDGADASEQISARTVSVRKFVKVSSERFVERNTVEQPARAFLNSVERSNEARARPEQSARLRVDQCRT